MMMLRREARCAMAKQAAPMAVSVTAAVTEEAAVGAICTPGAMAAVPAMSQAAMSQAVSTSVAVTVVAAAIAVASGHVDAAAAGASDDRQGGERQQESTHGGDPSRAVGRARTGSGIGGALGGANRLSLIFLIGGTTGKVKRIGANRSTRPAARSAHCKTYGW
jgi:hypothetical protein